MMKEKYLNQVDGDIPSKRYMFTMIDKDSKTILRIVSLKESLKEVVVQMKVRRTILRVNAMNEEEIEKSTSLNPGIFYCNCCDQYSRTIGNPFIVIVDKSANKD